MTKDDVSIFKDVCGYHHLLAYSHSSYQCIYVQIIFRAQIIDLWIVFVFSQITLSSPLWNLQFKTFLLNFWLQGNRKAFVYTSRLTYRLYHTPKSVTNCTSFYCIWISFRTKPLRGQLAILSHTPSCWNYSLNFCGSSLKR